MGETTPPAAGKPPQTASAGAAKTPPGGMPDVVRFPLVLTIVGGIAALGLSVMYFLTKDQLEAAEGRKAAEAFASVLGERYATATPKTGPAGPWFELRDRDGATIACATAVDCPGSYNAGDPVRLMVVTDARAQRILGVRVVQSKETPGLGERINDSIAPRSLWGWIVGRRAKERVVLRSGGALVGAIDRNADGSLEIVRGDGGAKSIPAADVAGISGAPFPPAFVDQFTGIGVRDALLRQNGGAIDALTGATVTSKAVVAGVGAAVERLSKVTAAAE